MMRMELFWISKTHEILGSNNPEVQAPFSIGAQSRADAHTSAYAFWGHRGTQSELHWHMPHCRM